MPEIDRRLLIAAPIAVIVVFLIGFAFGRTTAGGSDTAAPDDSTTTTFLATNDQGGADTSTTQDAGQMTDTTRITGDPTVVLPPPPTDPEAIPPYGTDDDRVALIAGLVEAGVTGGSEADILATADYVCYTLERLRAQGRSLSFTVRVVWNEALSDLAREDLSAFGTVLAAAPPHLCPENAAFGERVSYWLGY